MIFRILLFLIALAVLAGMGHLQYQRGLIMSPHEVEAYHAGIRQAVAEVPYVVGDYIGEDIPVPQGAVELLKPNVILSRRYTKLSTNETVDLLFVHCKDAQDMIGHHPPVCYPSHGWVTERGEDVIDTSDRFATYRATRQVGRQAQAMQIKQGLLLYQHSVTPNMNTALMMSTRRSLRALGAGQVQLLTPMVEYEDDIEQRIAPFAGIVEALASAVILPEAEAVDKESDVGE